MIPVPPKSAEEAAADASILAQMRELTEILHQRNLDTAVRLAELASRRQLPRDLEKHFGELGRRYSELVDQVAMRRPATPRLRLVAESGAEVGQ
jgi:hypothetical protein